MKLLIKNMVCPRCIIAVKEILEYEVVTEKLYRSLGHHGRVSLDAL